MQLNQILFNNLLGMYFSERNSFKKPHQNQMNNKCSILKKKKKTISETLGLLFGNG